MSHVVASEVRFGSELDDIKATCAELGAEFRENQTTFGWYGSWQNDYHAAEAAVTQGHDPKTFGKCIHAIRVPGSSYEVGLVARRDGKPGYEALFDAWGDNGRKIEQRLGKGLGTLNQKYGARVAERAMRQDLGRKGYQVTRTTNAQGEVELLAVKRG